MVVRLSILLFISGLCFPQAVWSADDDDLDAIESELERSKPAPTPPPPPERAIDPKIVKLGELKNLAPFSDVSVLQKKFLPKTERFQLNVGLTSVANNAYFTNFGLLGRLGYHFTEAWGLEGHAAFMSKGNRQVTDDLKEKRGVTTDNQVTPKSHYGLGIFWSPIYGKMSWLNKKIVPFDIYFGLGYAITNTNLNENVGTLAFSTGQIFALSKSMAFRWDLHLNAYNAKSRVLTTDASGNIIRTDEPRQNFQDLMFTAGFSFFLPEAKYR